MKSPHYFIIEPFEGKRYDNVRKYGSCELILSSSQEDHTVTNRIGVVIETPLYYDGPIKKGDLIVVHHNVFRIYTDIRGNEKSSWNYYKENIFIVDADQIFLYREENKEWKAPYPYCFIEPIKAKEEGLLIAQEYEALFGKVVYYPKSHNEVRINDIVSFKPESEYEFMIDDRKLYRMKLNSLCLKI
jgi:hypothetical protein